MADKLKDKGENRLISKPMRTILHALSYGNIEVEASRKLADLKKLDAMKIFWKKLDTKVYNKEYEVPIRLYFPSEEMMEEGISGQQSLPVLLFFHGGGWVTEGVETYDRVCARMAQSTGQIVASVEYRLALNIVFPYPWRIVTRRPGLFIQTTLSFTQNRKGSRSWATAPAEIWRRRWC